MANRAITKQKPLKIVKIITLVLMLGASVGLSAVGTWPSTLNYELGPIPDVPTPGPENSVQMDDSGSFEEVQLDLPVTAGPFEPTWESIEENYPGTPTWLREAKFGIWVHFGPQSAGQSGDWYARRLYIPGTTAYNNHLANYGHPSEVGYKEVLRDWNPDKLNPRELVEIYQDAGARFLIIQGVHHDQFDNWDSRYQPWNSSRLGPQRDLLGEWEQAARDADIRFGVTFHHEYSWWWWQTAFQSDTSGSMAGVPYDGNLTLADGQGKWWEGLDPRLLYGVNLREYNGVADAANSAWSPPPAGIFQNHLNFAEWYAKWWAARMMDVVDKYQPDFIYTDGTDQQPFSGFGTGTGYRCDAMQHVIADYYNKTLTRRGQVDVFSIVKFRHKTNGTVNTQEGGIPSGIKTDQDWIAETPVGDWFYSPGFTYSSDAVIRYLLEEVSRDGNIGLCVSLLPDGSLDAGSTNMLREIGEWMRINGDGIYGSHAWQVLGEGANGTLNILPGGKLGWSQANYQFYTTDFRFTVGKDGCLYAYCMTAPSVGTHLAITSLGTSSGLLAEPITSVTLLGHDGSLTWSQDADALRITCPSSMNFQTAIGFKIGPSSIILPTTPSDLTATPSVPNIVLNWKSSVSAAYTVKRAESSDGPYTTLATGLAETSYIDLTAAAGTPYYYVVAATIGTHTSSDSEPAPALLPVGSTTWISQDIGNVGKTGSFIQADNTLLVKGSGADIWYSSDSFQYVYKTLSGDGSITVKVESMQNTAPWAKAGIMIRETLDANSRQVITFMSPNNGIALQGRSSTGGSTTGFAEESGLTAPYWLRLERVGNLFTAYRSSDGSTWTPLGSTTIAMATSVKMGPAVCSVNNGTLCNAVFSHVEMIRQTTATLVNRATGGIATASEEKVTEPASNAFDGSTGTKWFNENDGPTGWLQYDFGPGNAWTVVRYDLSSANDAAGRDPKNWQFLGSNDGVNWTVLDTRTGETFDSRYKTKQYAIVNSTAYRYYRLNITANNGDLVSLQLSELALMTHDYYNGDRGMVDLLELVAQWLLIDCTDVPACSGADITGDTNVDLFDLAEMGRSWQTGL